MDDSTFIFVKYVIILDKIEQIIAKTNVFLFVKQ